MGGAARYNRETGPCIDGALYPQVDPVGTDRPSTPARAGYAVTGRAVRPENPSTPAPKEPLAITPAGRGAGTDGLPVGTDPVYQLGFNPPVSSS